MVDQLVLVVLDPEVGPVDGLVVVGGDRGLDQRHFTAEDLGEAEPLVMKGVWCHCPEGV